MLESPGRLTYTIAASALSPYIMEPLGCIKPSHTTPVERTDRDIMLESNRHALQAMATVGDLASRYNAVVQDNRLLKSLVDRLERDLSDIRETVELLSGIILNGSPEGS